MSQSTDASEHGGGWHTSHLDEVYMPWLLPDGLQNVRNETKIE
jgi:hypothetical protein